MYAKRPFVAFVAPIVVAVANIVGIRAVGTKRARRKLRHDLLAAISAEFFSDDRQQIRLTLFGKVGPVRSLYYFVVRFFGAIVRYLRRLPPDWPRISQRYLRIFQRYGTEYRYSKTFFYYDPDTESGCEGIAARVFQTGRSIVVPDLPVLDKTLIRAIRDPRQSPREVQTYLHSTGSKLHTLKRLNVLARHLAGEVIFDGEGEPVGVLMLDSTLSENPFDTSVMEDIRRRYMRLFQRLMP